MPVLTLANGMGNSKIMMSPYQDDTFIFVNKKLNSLKEVYSFMQKNYSLCMPLNLKSPEKMLKSKKDFGVFVAPIIHNITISLTEIKSRNSVQDIIDYFSNKNNACIIGTNTNYNGKNNFDLVVVLKVNFLNNEETIKNTLMVMQSELQELCHVDLYASSCTSVQPPIGKGLILHSMENGNILRNSDIKPVLSTKHNSKYLQISDDFLDLCLVQFSELGFHASTSKAKDNGINFYRKYENSTVRGFTFYLDNPFIMYHKEKQKQISIFHLVKNTKEGKDFLKSKTKEQQSKELIRNTDINFYEQYQMVDEQYLNFDSHNKKNMVENFLKSDKGVFKLKSPMGTAKSTGINYVISEAHKKDLKVIIVSNRVSVAKDFIEKYKEHGLIYYQDPAAHETKGSLVVQYDSLHRFKMKNYDVVIFDEYVSLLLHHRGALTDNANINAVMFKVLQDNKKVVIADAFLTGYEQIFFEDRKVWFLENKYKDEVKLFDYSSREYFITELIKHAGKLNDGEHISASFTSLQIIRLVEYELRRAGIKVVSLTSETPETTRDIIYRSFAKEEHNSFQVILYTPTLTVGVSNLNNVVSHWHYDSAMGADVISSLQMIKRSRKSEEIHYFIQSRQNHFETNVDTLNRNAHQSISQYYSGKDKTLLVEMNYETGELELTPLATYINKIEAFYNILANNHANAFRLLLQYQFKDVPVLIDKTDNKYNIKEIQDKIKKHIRENNLKILEEFGEVEYTDEEVNLIKNKISQKTPEERVQLILKGIQDKFAKKIPKNKLKELARLEIEYSGKFVQSVKNVHAVQQANGTAYARYELSEAISTNISSLQSKKHVLFLENLVRFDGNILNTTYTKPEVNSINQENYGGKKKFEKFINDLGYTYNTKEKIYEADVKIYNYIPYI